MDEAGSPNTMVVMPPLPLGKPFPPHSSSHQLALISFLSCSSPSSSIQIQLAPSPNLDMSSAILDICPLPFLKCPLPFLICPLPFLICPLPFLIRPLPFFICMKFSFLERGPTTLVHTVAPCNRWDRLFRKHTLFISDADTNYSRTTDFPQSDDIKSEM